jgi:hypothetical protein
MKFNIGDRVGLAVDAVSWRESAPDFGVVSDITKNGLVMVQWDSRWKTSNLPMDPDLLLPEAEVETKVSELNDEFDKVSKKIAVEMNKAAKAIDAASELAATLGISLSDMYEAYRPLYQAMDGAGWNTSSFSC